MSQNVLVKKLTIKSLLVTKRPVAGGSEVHVGRIVGEANGSTRAVSTQYGTTIEFGGSFAGVSLVTDAATGEIVERTVKSNKLFLPSIGEALLAEAIAGGQSARFGFDVFIRFRKIGENDGYEYELKSLFEPSEGDALTNMLKEMPALPGSSKAKQLSLVEATPTEIVAQEQVAPQAEPSREEVLQKEAADTTPKQKRK